MSRAVKLMTGLALLLAAIGLAGCGESPPETRRVELTGRVIAPEGVTGPVEVRLFHAWSLEGALRHPLQLIEFFPAEAGVPFTHSFDYRPDIGEGLVVFAWIDTDGDGVHCTPTAREDMSGLAEASGDAGQVEVTVVLTDYCRAPGWFFPPKPAA
jgi:hypothetical protein